MFISEIGVQLHVFMSLNDTFNVVASKPNNGT